MNQRYEANIQKISVTKFKRNKGQIKTINQMRFYLKNKNLKN